MSVCVCVQGFSVICIYKCSVDTEINLVLVLNLAWIFFFFSFVSFLFMLKCCDTIDQTLNAKGSYLLDRGMM